ncbi:MAG: hypothetical protein QF441_04605 [Bacteriovoracaceae bacterium]|nr:hypothetical protein [Bacteriovoracaceae bacterium]
MLNDEKHLLAIDLGSNAMRAARAIFDEASDLEVIENYRFALRLGEDVFDSGKISSKKIDLTEDAFKHLYEIIEEFQISKIRAVATSALRNATNRKELIQLIKKKYNLELELIDGIKEAKLIYQGINALLNLNQGQSLLIDIGGGSTEITITKEGQVIYSKSFKCGTVRLIQLNSLKEYKHVSQQLSQQIKNDLKKLNIPAKFDLCVGTGGNLRRMGKLRNTFFQRSHLKIKQTELSAIYNEVSKFSIDQRIKLLSMRKDRADVIAPAMSLIEELMILFDIHELMLPQVGLKEGLLIDMLPSSPRYLYL